MNKDYKAKILNPLNPTDFEQIQKFTATEGVEVFDTIKSQILELLLCRSPLKSDSDFTDADILSFAGGNFASYGVWAYYSWNNSLIHVLSEQEFIEVRTNRNRNKITAEEQSVLSNMTVGIAGLSVGRSAAITIATERIAGKIVLADFDVLELSNLNRIKSTLADLGLNKCISTAREIAQMDPFLDIYCYTDGLTEGNLDQFLSHGNGLDIFVEECDDLSIKINSRLRAKKMKIPVIMEASDRCLVDIERFDIEPERPILHGILDEADINSVGSLKTFEEKLKLMSKIVDVNKVSEGMRLSLPEIGKSLRTWPQLASDVTYGGGVTTTLIRMILLKKIFVSGRYYLDPKLLLK
ncbi:MAG: ThiF family adenylyltransferase [Bacteroidia bacterium]